MTLNNIVLSILSGIGRGLELIVIVPILLILLLSFIVLFIAVVVVALPISLIKAVVGVDSKDK